MDHILVELLQTIKHEKQGCEPKVYDMGTLLKVIHDSHDTYLVTADDEPFSFSLRKVDEGTVWVKV